MDIFNLFTMIGGLALFLYGMQTMGDGLSKMAGGKLEKILETLTTKKIYAVLLGAGVTAVIQSSSATTVMVVGFVNSGMMKLTQSVGIIMGANIGTTITSWMLSLTGIQGSTIWLKLLKPSSFAPLLAGIGIIMIMTSNIESKKKDIGTILIGFAILMFGMETMSGSVSGLAAIPAFQNLMVRFSNPILGMLAGTILTAIIQSSSASVGILQALCLSGAIKYNVALPIIMGQNIGTCVTSVISSIGATKNAKRAAMCHLYFNLIGTVLFMGCFYASNSFIHYAFLTNQANAAGIAMIHSLFNIGATIVLYPFSNQLVKLAEITIKDESKEENQNTDLITLDERFLSNPAFAIELCRGKVKEMAKIAERSLDLSLNMLIHFNEQSYQEVQQYEDISDQYEDVLGSYLVKLSGKSLSSQDSLTSSLILHSISDIERICDLSNDLAKSFYEINKKNLAFSDIAKNEISMLCIAVRDISHLAIQCFSEENETIARSIEPLEEVIDTLTKQIKNNHIQRLQQGTCSIEMGFILEDVLTVLERISDHFSNIAIELITINNHDYNTHDYFRSLDNEQQKLFQEEYEHYLKMYSINNVVI